MSEARKVIEIVFAGVDETSKVIDNIGSSVSGFADSLQSVTSPIDALTDKLLLFEAAVGAMALAVGTFSVNEAAKFDSAIREIVTLVNGSVTQVDALADTVRSFAAVSAFSFDDYTAAVYRAVSATGTIEDGVKAVEQAEKLAVAGRATLNDTTLLLVSTLNAYGAGMGEAQRFSDAFFAAVQGGQTTINELAQSLGQVAPTANAAGVDIEELAGAMAFLTKNGLDTSQAATGLKAAISNVIKPSGDAKDAAKQLGLQFDVGAIASKGFAGFIEEISKKTGGSVTTMGQLFGSVEGLNAVLILAQNGGQGFSAALDQINNSAGATDKAYQLLSDTVTVQTQKMVNAIVAAGIAIGEGLQEPVIGVEKAIEAVFLAIQQAADSGAFDPLIDALKDGLGIIEEVLNTVAKNLPEALAQADYSKFIQALEDLADVVSSIFDGVDLTTPEGLARAIQKIVDVGTLLTNITTGIAEKIVPLINKLAEWALRSTQLDTDTQKLIGNLLGFNKILDAVLPAVSNLGIAITGLGAVMGVNGLLGILLKLSTLSSGALLTGIFGLGAAALVVSNQYFDWTGKIKALNESLGLGGLTSGLAGILPEVDKLTSSTDALTSGFVDIETEAGKLEVAAGANREEFAAWALVADALGGQLQLTKDGLFEIVFAAEKTTKAAKETGDTFAFAAAKLDPFLRLIEGTGERSERATDLMNSGFRAVGETIEGTEKSFAQFSHASSKAEDDFKKVATAAELTAEKAAELALKSEELSIEWEKLASQERSITLQVLGDIRVAEIQAQAQQVVAAFESINTAIESTGETMSSLAKLFVEARGFAQTTLERLLEEENERRKQTFELQKQLVQAQIDYLRATTDRLNSGDAFITVSADGLEPQLEAFMFKILERVQIKANAEGQLFLLGLGA